MTEDLTRQVLADNVADAILSLAAGEKLRAGDPLPPVIRLAAQFNVSRAVVREALERLAVQGAVERAEGQRWVLLAAGRRRQRHANGKGATPPTEIARRPLSDQAADAVLELIVEQKLKEGESLPPSGELARRLGVSQIVMREALASLAARGILRRRQGREPVVALPDHELVGGILLVRAHLDEIGITDFQVARAALEQEAVRLAARHPDEARRRILLGPVEGMRAAKTEKAFNDSDLAFHRAIARLSGNRAIELLLASLDSIVRETVETGNRRVRSREGAAGVEKAVANHQRVADAVVKGDADAAAAAMHRHFDYVRPGPPEKRV